MVLQTGWPIPLWIGTIVLLSATLFAIWIYWTERGPAGRPLRILLAAIRSVLLASVLWMISGWVWQQFETERPELAIVVDCSSSMATRDVVSSASGDGLQSRLDRVEQILDQIPQQTLSTLKSRYSIQWFSAAESLKSIPSPLSEGRPMPVADESQSRLGDSLERLVELQAGRGTAAIVIFTDGINTVGSSLAEAERAARTAAIPIHAVATGRPFALPDVRLADLLIGREIYLGDSIAAEVTVIASDIRDAKVKVTLSNATSGETLDEIQLELSAKRNQQSVRLHFVPESPGEIELNLTVSSIETETELDNNRLTAKVNVQNKAIRVLLVSEQPSYEFRFLKNLLDRTRESDSSVPASFQVESVLQESDPGYVQQDSSARRLVPSNTQELSGYDVFIFGAIDPNLISRRSQRTIVESVVDSGAGCIFIYGSGNPIQELQGWPLRELLPIQSTESPTELVPTISLGYRWKPTTLGQDALPLQLSPSPTESLALWNRLPSFTSICMVGNPRVGAQVLAQATAGSAEYPLLITQYAGAGRVALQATDETYHWTSFRGNDAIHQKYWGQMLRWLSRGKLIKNSKISELTVEPRQSKIGQPIRFEARIGKELSESELPETVDVVVESEDQDRQTVTLTRSQNSNRRFLATVGKFQPGNYQALLVNPATASPPNQEFVVTNPPGEQSNLQTNVQGLRSLATESRGKFYDASEATTLFEELPRGRPTRLGSLPSSPLWNHPWVPLIFVLLITSEWLIRRSARML